MVLIQMSNHYIKIELERVLKEDLVRHTGIGLMTGVDLNSRRSEKRFRRNFKIDSINR